jgi:hypothetical protein
VTNSAPTIKERVAPLLSSPVLAMWILAIKCSSRHSLQTGKELREHMRKMATAPGPVTISNEFA